MASQMGKIADVQGSATVDWSPLGDIYVKYVMCGRMLSIVAVPGVDGDIMSQCTLVTCSLHLALTRRDRDCVVVFGGQSRNSPTWIGLLSAYFFHKSG